MAKIEFKNQKELNAKFELWIKEINESYTEQTLKYYVNVSINANRVMDYVKKNRLEIEKLRDTNNINAITWLLYKDKRIKTIKEFNRINNLVDQKKKNEYEILNDNLKITESQYNKYKSRFNSTADWYLEQNKQFYSDYISKDELKEIIDCIVDIFKNTHSQHASVGAPKKVINQHNNIVDIFNLIIEFESGIDNFEIACGKIKGINRVAKEAYSLYNLNKPESYLFNGTVKTVFKEIFKDYKANDSILNSREYYQFFKYNFSDNLKKISGLFANQAKNFKIDDSKGYITNNVLFDNFLRWLSEQQTPNNKKSKKKSDSNEMDKDDNNKTKERDNTYKRNKLNQILYGPPGTGKTYHTINRALEIIFDSWDEKNDPTLHCEVDGAEYEFKLSEIKDKLDTDDKINRAKIQSAFEYFKKPEQGQIVFTTFHQSYGYEEFVEGIKAKTEKDKESNIVVTYSVEDGVFKQISDNAKDVNVRTSNIYDFKDKVNIWKISLGDSQNKEDDYVFDYCIENKMILLGYGKGHDYSKCKDPDEISKILHDPYDSFAVSAVNTFKNKIKKGDIVLVSYGNTKLRGIAKITGDYKYVSSDEIQDYRQSRSVEWILIPSEPFTYDKILQKRFSQMTIYNIKKNVKIENLKKLLTNDETVRIKKNYVLIIDEINRGNISKIFGELITLIEESKRLGNTEQLKVKLPYSGEEFGVPKNLYVIGTMNTADRSIALMDTALRRRFQFEEMMPNLDLLKVKNENDEETDLEVDGINIRKMLQKINERIEYLYDRDHTIGHSYFLPLKENNKLDKLNDIFKTNVIPLLQEYFYDDWEKIQIVLGDHFKQFINYQSLFSKDEKHKFIKSEEDEVFRNENFNEDLKNEYRFIQSKKAIETKVLGFDHDDIEDDKKEYRINDKFEPECYMKIYKEK